MNLLNAEMYCINAGAQLDRGRKRVLNFGPLRHPMPVHFQNGSVAAMRFLLIDGGYKSNHPDAEEMYREKIDAPIGDESPQTTADKWQSAVKNALGFIDSEEAAKLESAGALSNKEIDQINIERSLAICTLSIWVFPEIDAMFDAMRIIKSKPVKIKIDKSISNEKLADYFNQIAAEISRRLNAGEILPGELTGNAGDSAGNSPATGSGAGEGPRE